MLVELFDAADRIVAPVAPPAGAATGDTPLVVPGVVWSMPTLPMIAAPATSTGAVAIVTATLLFGLIATTCAGSAATAAVDAALTAAVVTPSVTFTNQALATTAAVP